MSRLDAIRQKKQEAKQRKARSFSYVDTVKAERLGIPQYKAADGDNFLYIVPPADPNSYFGREIWKHSNVGADGVTFLCPKKMQNKYCPICADIIKLKAKDPQDEAIQDLRPASRFLFFVVDVKNSETEKKGPQWYDAPISVNDAIVKASEDKRTGQVVDVSDPKKGCNVLFAKSGSMKKTRYDSFELEPRESPAKKDWLDVPEFDDILNFVDADIIEVTYTGGIKEASEDSSDKGSEEKESPRGRRTAEKTEEPEEAPRGRRSTEDADDDRSEKLRGRRVAEDKDEEPEEEVEAPEEEVEAPRGRRAAEDKEKDKEKEKEVEEPENSGLHDRVRRRVSETAAEDAEPTRRRRS